MASTVNKFDKMFSKKKKEKEKRISATMNYNSLCYVKLLHGVEIQKNVDNNRSLSIYILSSINSYTFWGY